MIRAGGTGSGRPFEPGALGLFARAAEVPGTRQPSVIRLGGVGLYAADEITLERGVERLADAISTGAGSHASLDRKLLLSVVAKILGTRLDPRVFGAVVGRQLRLGKIDGIACASTSGKAFRVYVASERYPEFIQRLEELRSWLEQARTLKVADVRKRFFPNAAWGSWSSASHIPARAVLVGYARCVDRFTYSWPDGLEDAVR